MQETFYTIIAMIFGIIYACINKKSRYLLRNASSLPPVVLHYLNSIKRFDSCPLIVTISSKLFIYYFGNNRKHEELGVKLSSSTLNPQELARIGKEYSQLNGLVGLTNQRLEAVKQRKELTDLIDESSRYREVSPIYLQLSAKSICVNLHIGLRKHQN